MKTVRIQNIITGAFNVAEIDEKTDFAILSTPNDYKANGICVGTISGMTLSGLLKEWKILEELKEEEF